jgi:hypothetical protein
MSKDEGKNIGGGSLKNEGEDGDRGNQDANGRVYVRVEDDDDNQDKTAANESSIDKTKGSGVGKAKTEGRDVFKNGENKGSLYTFRAEGSGSLRYQDKYGNQGFYRSRSSHSAQSENISWNRQNYRTNGESVRRQYRTGNLDERMQEDGDPYTGSEEENKQRNRHPFSRNYDENQNDNGSSMEGMDNTGGGSMQSGSQSGRRLGGGIDRGRIREYLHMMKYPVTKQDIINAARSNSVPDIIMSLVNKFPDKTFNAPEEIEEEFRKIR